MIGIPKLEYSPHQARGLQALLSRQERFQTPENNPQPEASQTNLPADNTETLDLGGCVCFEGDSE